MNLGRLIPAAEGGGSVLSKQWLLEHFCRPKLKLQIGGKTTHLPDPQLQYKMIWGGKSNLSIYTEINI